MKEVEFISKTAKKEYLELPEEAYEQFKRDITILKRDQRPYLPIEMLTSVGKGVYELKINGSPAYRCVYVAKYKDKLVILGAFTKTTNGSDNAIRTTCQKRHKAMIKKFGQP